MKGNFILIEGPDDAVKAAVIAELKKICDGRDDVIFARELAGTAGAEHLAKVILPAVKDGKLVIYDRLRMRTICRIIMMSSKITLCE